MVADRELGRLARVIRGAGVRTKQHGVAFYRCALEGGEAAREAKAKLPHGQFTDWLRDNCNVTPQMARRWMQLASRGFTAEEIAEAGGIRALLIAPTAQNEPGFVLPGEDAEDATEPQNGSSAVLPGDNPPADAEAVLSETEAKWERDEDRTARRRRDAIQRKQDIRDGQTEPLTKMEKLQAENAQLQGRVEALEKENAELRARIDSLEASLGAGNAA